MKNSTQKEAVQLHQQRTALTLSELRFLESALRHQNKWLTRKEWAETSGTIHWTLQRILPRFVRMGLMSREEIHPAVFYSLTDAAKAKSVMATYQRQIAVLRSREAA